MVNRFRKGRINYIPYGYGKYNSFIVGSVNE